MPITITTHEDWSKLSDLGLKTVIDPMVFRCGEIFLQGHSGVNDPESSYQLLNKNIHALGMFFDRLILNERLPVFNYGDTFDMRLNFNDRTLAQINESEEVLYDVDVDYNVYHQIKNAAIKELERLYDGEQKVERAEVENILSELEVAGYDWHPNIEDLEEKLSNQEEKTLAAFLLGGLIFSGYAKILESEHVIQPKRSRIILALGLNKSSRFEFEEALFAELKQRAGKQYEEIPWMPTFFPYLLHKADTPALLLKELVRLRKSNQIKEYRAWLSEAINDFEDNGRISERKRREVKSIAKHIDKITGKAPSLPKAELKVSLVDIGLPGISAGLDFAPLAGRIWGWFLKEIPGRRYRKILTRAVIADKEYVQIENRIKKIWT